MQPTESNNKIEWERLQLSRSKLKASSKTSALLAGFAMVAIVELDLPNDQLKKIPTGLLICFGVCTILLVSVHLMALMIATCILPFVETVAQQESTVTLPDIERSPHKSMAVFITIAWMLSNVFGLFLFLVEMLLLIRIRFGAYESTANVCTVLIAIVMLVFISFAVHFYRKLSVHKLDQTLALLKEAEDLAEECRNEKSRNQPGVLIV